MRGKRERLSPLLGCILLAGMIHPTPMQWYPVVCTRASHHGRAAAEPRGTPVTLLFWSVAPGWVMALGPLGCTISEMWWREEGEASINPDLLGSQAASDKNKGFGTYCGCHTSGKTELPGVRHSGSLSEPVLMDSLTYLWLPVTKPVLVGPCAALWQHGRGRELFSLMTTSKLEERNSLLWGWWGTGTGCPEKLWMPPPWACSSPGWTGLWATWSSGRCPCPWQGGWN